MKMPAEANPFATALSVSSDGAPFPQVNDRTPAWRPLDRPVGSILDSNPSRSLLVLSNVPDQLTFSIHPGDSIRPQS
jgi:hypothetical protein